MKHLIVDFGNSESLSGMLSLEQVIKIIQQVDKESEIVIHTRQTEYITNYNSVKIDRGIYEYITSSNSKMIKLFRFIEILIYSSMKKIYLFQNNLLNNAKIARICKDMSEFDTFIFTGGNYLKASSNISSTLDLIIKNYILGMTSEDKIKRIIMPTTVGPFSFKFQEKCVRKALNNFSLVFLRDLNSYNTLLKKIDAKVVKSVEIILLNRGLVRENNNIGDNIIRVGIGFRNWNADRTFLNFEKSIYEFLLNQKNLKIYPIFLDLSDNKLGSSKEKSAYKIFEKEANSIRVKLDKIFILDSLEAAKELSNKVDIVISPRTNLTFLSILASKPFIAYSKYAKVNNVLKTSGFEKYFIRERQMTSRKFENIFYSLLKNLKIEGQSIKNRMEIIRTNEKQKMINEIKNVLFSIQ